MKGWMYWNRNNVDGRWVKVFVVIKSEFLCIFKDSKSSKKPFMHIAITKVEYANECFRIFDMNSSVVDLYPYNKSKREEWSSALLHAATLTTSHFNTFVVHMKNLPKRSLFHGSLKEFNKSQKKTLPAQLLSYVRQQMSRRIDMIMECFDE